MQKMIIGIILLIIIGAFMGLPIWLLWNWIMPNITIEPFFKEISFFQAIGLGILSSVLFKNTNNNNK